jgi:hypothetical protein
MPLSFDDEAEQAPPPAAAEQPPETPARGQLLYEALVAVVSETEEAQLLGLFEALRKGLGRTGRPVVPWLQLSPRVQRVIATLDGRLFDDAEE